MENVNDKLTRVLLDLNRYCYEKHIEFNIDCNDAKKNHIEKTRYGIINLTLSDINDEKFYNEVSQFLKDLLQ